MPVLTKEDLKDWNTHPVTKMIFKQIEDYQITIAMESTLQVTVDETAMHTAHNSGLLEGVGLLIDTYKEKLSKMEDDE